MKNILLALGCLSLLISCGVSYDGETRLISQLHVVDSQGTPIPNLTIDVHVNDDDNSDFEDNSTPATDRTDANGNSTIAFLAPEKTEGRIELVIYEYDQYNTVNFEPAYLSNLRKRNFVDFKLPVGEIVMYRPEELVNLSIYFQEVSGDEFVSADVLGVFTNRRFNGYFNNENNSYINLYAKKNQTITLEYFTINSSSGQQTSHTQEITVGDQPIETIINY